ncbi:MAG: ABC transporter substrate-binding protein [Chromatiales bacterium]|nr:ABC transporter substrate-binding protein [Chromatiales bacterium]
MITTSRALVLLLIAFAGSAAAERGDPRALVEGTTSAVIAELRERRASIEQSPSELAALVDRLIVPHFDFERMASYALGNYQRRFNEASRAEFTALFRTLLISTYAKALLEFRDQLINVSPLRLNPGDDDVMVRTKIIEGGAPPLAIDYRLHYGESGWKVYDMSIEGVSVVSTYRRSFASHIRRHGPDSLIERMRDRNAAESPA